MQIERTTAALRPEFPGVTISNGGYDKAEAALAAGTADLVSFGAPFLTNPDLPARFQSDAPLNTPDPATFYGSGAKGYTDYPSLSK